MYTFLNKWWKSTKSDYLLTLEFGVQGFGVEPLVWRCSTEVPSSHTELIMFAFSCVAFQTPTLFSGSWSAPLVMEAFITLWVVYSSIVLAGLPPFGLTTLFTLYLTGPLI